ncbi:DUF4469 domain-containing protein [Bacteroides timonensis]|uniref:DUF4469 domain-containing protein n=1 Tax=Bacteroides timonensis TaxID=1470345 RepID=UPI0004BB8CEE|nr:DNA-binding domain-containing protein [Bacteroides timonensis]
MAEEIKYQMNGQLADNAVTVDNKEDMILVPVSNGTADEARIIAEMKAEDSGLREETIQHVFALRNRVVKRLLLSGINVNDGITYASTVFHGVIENSQWNPQKNSIAVNFQMGAELREAIKRTTVNIIGEKGSAIYIGGVTDASTRAQDASATAGRAFTLTGSKIRVAGTDAAVGITLTSAGGTVTKITDDLYVMNDPSKVTFIIPANLGNGTYTLKLTTQYGGNSKQQLKSPRSVEKTIYIGTAPAGGGGTSGGPDGGLEENPLG